MRSFTTSVCLKGCNSVDSRLLCRYVDRAVHGPTFNSLK